MTVWNDKDNPPQEEVKEPFDPFEGLDNGDFTELADSAVRGGEEVLGARRVDYSGPEPLHDPRKPAYALKYENPTHREIVYMKLQGLSNREIAKRLGKTDAMVNYTLKQPWAKRMLVELMHERGVEGIDGLLAGAVEDSIHTLIELRDDSDTPHAVRRGAATDILDRYFGKPTQKVETRTGKLSDDGDSLVRELEQLDAEIGRLRGVEGSNN